MNRSSHPSKARRTPLSYLIGMVLLGVVAYNSVYFKKLDEVRASTGPNVNQKFDPSAYTGKFWTEKLIPATPKAVELNILMPLLKTDQAKAFDLYSHALGIGNIRYFLVKGEGKITAVGANDLTVSLTTGEIVHLATEYIFGNAVRDASGLIQITEFDNTTDLNNVSAELNTIIRNKVIPNLKTSAKLGSTLKFVGAIELNKEHLHLDNLEVIPIAVKQRAEGMGVGAAGKE